jgi:hypothetical protein
MGFEGKFYVGLYDPDDPCTSQDDPRMVLAESIRNPKYSYKFDEVDVTLRKHRGTKAYQKGMLDISLSFSLPNMNDLPVEQIPADAALILMSLRDRHMPLTIIMLDKEFGEGIIGEFELLGGDKSEEDANVQEFEIEAKPSAAGRKVEWYVSPLPPTP